MLAVDQVRRLLPAEPRWDSRSHAAVDEAIANLGRFSVVGVLEELERFGDRYAARFGVRPSFGQLNTGEVRRRAPIPDGIRRRVVELCEPSRRLYEAARGRSG